MPRLAAKFGNAPQELCDPVGFQGDGLGGGGPWRVLEQISLCEGIAIGCCQLYGQQHKLWQQH